MERACPAATGTRITIPFPDDFHHHFRDGPVTPSILPLVMQRFGRCIAMPNTNPPKTTTAAALGYYDELMGCLDPDKYPSTFEPLMTLCLTDNTTPEEVRSTQIALTRG